MAYYMPYGTPTNNKEEYADAWYLFCKPITMSMNLGLVSFDPEVTVFDRTRYEKTGQMVVADLPVWFIKRFNKMQREKGE